MEDLRIVAESHEDKQNTKICVTKLEMQRVRKISPIMDCFRKNWKWVWVYGVVKHLAMGYDLGCTLALCFVCKWSGVVLTL